MKKYIILGLISLATTTIYGQGLGLHFMEHVAQTMHTNPANFPKQRFFLSLPSPYVSLSTNMASGNNLFIVNGDEWIPNFNNYVDNLDNEQFIRNDMALETFGLGFRVKGLGIFLGHSIKSYAQIGDTKNFLDLALNGNAGSIGETVNLDTDFRMGAYQEYVGGISISLLN